MTIAGTSNRVSYNGTGALTPLPIAFPFFSPTDLVVIETIIATGVQTTKVLTTDYTITGTVDALGHYSNGGTVTPVLAFPVTVTWNIYRDPPLTQQEINLVENDNLPAESVEAAFDYLTLLIQRIADRIARTVHQPDGDTNSVGLLPSAVGRAGKYLSFDGNGDPIASATVAAGSVVISPFMETVLDDASAATALATLGAMPAMNGVATNGTVAADPTTALGIASLQIVVQPALVSYTGNANIGAFTRTALLSGASFTLTLNTAVGHTGQMITFIHNGTSLTQVYTIDGAAVETIDGTTTYLLYTAGERLTIVSNGTNWIVLDHQARTEWVSAGAMTITGTGSNPTKPTTPDVDAVYWKRDGNRVSLRYILQISSAAGSAAGTGTYLFALPTNIALDTTVLTPIPTAITTTVRSEAAASYLRGTGMLVLDSNNETFAGFFAYDTTHFQVQNIGATDAAAVTSGPVGATDHALTNAEMAYMFELEGRAANWRL